MSAGLQVVYSKSTVTRECLEIERFSPAPVEHLSVGICCSGSREMINILIKYPCPVRKPPLCLIITVSYVGVGQMILLERIVPGFFVLAFSPLPFRAIA